MSKTPEKRPAYEPAARLLKPTGYDPDMPRPTSIYAGVGLIALRVVAGTFGLIALALGWQGVFVDFDASIDGLDSDIDLQDVARWIAVSVGGVVILVDAILAFFVFRGRNIARVLVMIFSTFSIAASFVSWWAQGQEITLNTTFYSLSLDVLILLALSSRSSAAYARRNERR